MPRGYKKEKEFRLRQSSSGIGSFNRELRESPELAVGRIMARDELDRAKKTSYVI
jgi:hypothetical protein